MADPVIPFSKGWTQIRRKDDRAIRRPTVCLRSSGDLALSSRFVRFAGVAGCTRVAIFVSADGYRVGLRFHSREDDEHSFQLSFDGGSARARGHDGRVVQASLPSHALTLAKLCSMPRWDRTFEPRKDVRGLWVIELRPCFENVFHGRRGDVGANETGIYRYMRQSEIVYIGRGRLLDRFSFSGRTSWEFDKIEYSILNDTESELKWEAHWLERFLEAHGRLPLYNRIMAHAGQSTAASETYG